MRKRLMLVAGVAMLAAGCLAGCSLLHSHEFGAWIPEPVGCEEPSVFVRTCECGEREEITLPARGHVLVTVAEVEATCTQAGSTEHEICAVCGEAITPAEEIAAYGHTPVTVAAVEATCTQAGATECEICAVCGETLTLAEEIAAYGHSWSLMTHTPALHFVRCDACGVIEEREHTWQGNACTVCGYEGGGSEGLSYEEGEDGLVVTGRGKSEDLALVIPAYYQGKAVVSVAERAFYRDAALVSVAIAGEGCAIGKEAFRYCTQLKSVSFAAGGKVGEYAFAGCDLIGTLVLPAGTQLSLGSFYACGGLTDVFLPADISEIAPWAFAECHALTHAIQEGGSGVVTLGNYAFFRCYALEEVNFLAGVCVWGDYAFTDCTALANVAYTSDIITYLGGGVLEGTAFFDAASNRTAEGALYLGNILLSVPQQTSGVFSVREGTRMLACRAFSDCTALTAVELPDSVTQMGAYAFYGCTSLVEIALPDAITRIECGTFADCTALERVDLPAALQVIEGYAFHSCAALNEIALPEGLVRIGDYAFENCASLTALVMPASLSEIGIRAFFDCDRLTSVQFVGASRWHLYENEFTTYYRSKTIDGTMTAREIAYDLTQTYTDFIWIKVS